MTYIEVIVALIILSIFFIGISQILLPIHNAWEKSLNDLKTANSIRFLADSFKNECIKTDRNIDSWKNNVKIIKELESIEVIEYKKNGILYALKAICNIAEEKIEILGLCVP